MKSLYNKSKFKISAQTWNDNLNYQMGHYNPLIRICISKIENRTTFKNKT